MLDLFVKFEGIVSLAGERFRPLGQVSVEALSQSIPETQVLFLRDFDFPAEDGTLCYGFALLWVASGWIRGSGPRFLSFGRRAL